MKKRVSILSLVVFASTLISPISVVTATQSINDDYLITIEKDQNINNNEEAIIENYIMQEEIINIDDEEDSEEVNISSE